MPNVDYTLDMSPIGMIFYVLKASDYTDGQRLEMEWKLLPKADGTPLHIHPAAAESYSVLEGELEVNLNGKWQTLTIGQSLTVPPGTAHTFRNKSDGITRIYNTHHPAMQFDKFFAGLCKVVNKHAKSDEKMKMDFGVIMDLSMLMKKYKNEMVSVKPPNFIVSILNIVGKIAGKRI